MDVWSLTRAAVRRWYVLLPGLALTAALVVLVGDRVQPEYETTGAVLLVPSAQSGYNPLAQSSGPEALQIIVSGSEVRGRLAAQGLDPAYELVVARRSPIFSLKVRSDSAEKAVATGAAVVEALEQELIRRQQELGVKPKAEARLEVLDAPDAVSVISSGLTRVRAVVALLGLALSVAAAVLLDDLLLLLLPRRARARSRARVQPAQVVEAVRPDAGAVPSRA